MISLEAILFYIFSFSIILVLLWLGKKNVIFEYFGVGLIICLSIFRYDIGNDYDHYFQGISSYIKVFSKFDIYSIGLTTLLNGYEPAMILFCLIAKWLPHPCIWVMAFYSIPTIILFYLSLKRVNGVFWGFFFLITIGILFFCWDGIRQALAISIFIYSIKFIEEQNLKKYILFILLGFCCHYSIILVSWVYVIKNLKTFPKLFTCILIIAYIGYILGFWQQFLAKAISLIGIYKDYADKVTNVEFNSGLGQLLRVTIYVIIMYAISKKNPFYSNLIFLGTLIFIISSGNLEINRVSYYLCDICLIGFPFIMRLRKKYILKYFLVISLIILGLKTLTTGANGCIPYDSIWGEKFEKGRFRVRAYRMK